MALRLKEGLGYIYYKCTCVEEENRELVCRLVRERDSASGLQYFVQFMEYNGRLDGWYNLSSIRPLTSDERATKDDALRRFSEKTLEVRLIDWLYLAGFKMEVWYDVPLPDQYQKEELFCCEFCLNYMNCRQAYDAHSRQCQVRAPPGIEIYRDERVCFFEVDGAAQKRYCRNISYLARMFLQHKTLMTDVDIFMFYVMYAKIGDGYRLVGYFSKEKQLLPQITSSNILSCILTIPCYQGAHYGFVLIDMAYMLASRDNLIGSPEKPLSDLGYMAFSRYWKHRILEYLAQHEGNSVSIADIVNYTNFTAVDIESVLWENRLLIPRKAGDMVVYVKEEVMQQFLKDCERSETRAWRIQEKYLHYYPDVLVAREYVNEIPNVSVYVKNLKW